MWLSSRLVQVCSRSCWELTASSTWLLSDGTWSTQWYNNSSHPRLQYVTGSYGVISQCLHCKHMSYTLVIRWHKYRRWSGGGAAWATNQSPILVLRYHKFWGGWIFFQTQGHSSVHTCGWYAVKSCQDQTSRGSQECRSGTAQGCTNLVACTPQ